MHARASFLTSFGMIYRRVAACLLCDVQLKSIDVTFDV